MFWVFVNLSLSLSLALNALPISFPLRQVPVRTDSVVFVQACQWLCNLYLPIVSHAGLGKESSYLCTLALSTRPGMSQAFHPGVLLQMKA